MISDLAAELSPDDVASANLAVQEQAQEADLAKSKKRFSEHNKTAALFLFLDKADESVLYCDGTCDQEHFCVGPHHEEVAATTGLLSSVNSLFPERTVACADIWRGSICRTCKVDDWVTKQQRSDRWELALRSIHARDRARHADVPSITLEKVSICRFTVWCFPY